MGEYSANIRSVVDFLTEVSGSSGLNLELHPSWGYPILDQRNVLLGFKLRRANDPSERIMSLAVHPLAFDSRTNRLDSAARVRITQAITEFWGGQDSEPHVFVPVT